VRDLEIDLASRVVAVGGAPVQLSVKEYELLIGLAVDPVGYRLVAAAGRA
jgi:DNA-binding response OmpR family regulator